MSAVHWLHQDGHVLGVCWPTMDGWWLCLFVPPSHLEKVVNKSLAIHTSQVYM